MAATIGNFSSGDVLTAAEMNTLGMEYVGVYTFSGYGGIVIGGLDDFRRIRVFLNCYLTAGTSGVYLRFKDGGTELSGADYNYAAQATAMSSGSTATLNATSSANIRVGSIASVHSYYIIDVAKGYYGPRTSVMWSGNYGTAEYWHGAGTYYNAAADPDELYIYRTANLANMAANVYGYQ